MTGPLNVRSTPVLIAVLASGCMRAYTVSMGEQPSEDAHYVVVKTKWNGKMRLFDCLSRPDGSEWKPVCKQVKMQSTMGEALDDKWQKVRTNQGERRANR